MRTILDFEKPIAELESKLHELRHLSSSQDVDIASEMTRLEKKSEKLLLQTYSNLSSWQKVQVARHPERPHSSDYIARLITDFTPLAGDRLYAEDPAIIGGLGNFRGIPVMVLGHEKGKDTETRIRHNFGMPRPEGYRKATRLMRMANQFKLPVITFVDTAGAHPGIDAEERGQSEALATCIEMCTKLEVPMIAMVIGEGGSGGAVALAVGNAVMMLEHSVYSVISPEGCASILWRTRDKREDAAAAQKLTAQDLQSFGVIDTIVTEPLGGAHRSPIATIDALGDALEKTLKPLMNLDGKTLRNARREKFLNMGRQGAL
ncbi:Acetyl-coenzyme A carboxylase carboxyl transferase subunit alpha [Candidatus Bealeia paramacronuclearis]|uniref:Acetyl-coenzyme A carboxylase carboxyl transferase subunit alpha n=1 Tax=Candidatus Bealeia paramacronuclearis TaxID=1921001 RepID=A0ABZ2C5C1_9PROT|nr:Acetyl-coenzyme A carboxylase carboxyl transferase subunit alpha [Candidatus Bealeia paramacronuclearis]